MVNDLIKHLIDKNMYNIFIRILLYVSLACGLTGNGFVVQAVQ
jgi:hypothetical protein